MIHIGLSGGASKIAGLQGALKYLMRDKGIRPRIISGVSSGALLALPAALGKFKELDKLVQEFTLDDIFSKSPYNKRNKISLRAILRAVRGKNSLGVMGNLEKTIRSLVSEKEFKDYKRDSKYARVVTMSVDFVTGKRVFAEAKNLSYEDWIKHTMASAAIPGLAEPVLIDDMVLYDGSIRHHNISSYVMQTFAVSTNYSIYSRPKDLSHLREKGRNPKDIVEAGGRSADIMLYQISKQDEIDERQIAIIKNIKYNYQIFVPSVLTGLFDIDKSKLRLLYSKGMDSAKKVVG